MSAENVKKILKQIIYGFADCFKGITMLLQLDRKLYEEENKKRKATDPPKTFERKILKQLFKCVGVSLFFYISLCFFISLLPVLRILADVMGGAENFTLIEYYLHWLFSLFWLLPLNILLRTICAFWFSNLSMMVFTMRYGDPRPTAVHRQLADMIYSIVFEIIFLLQAVLFTYLSKDIAILGQLVEVFHYCLLYSLYAFEYKWSNMGLDLIVRLKILSSKWPYYLGFGFPIYLLNNVFEVPYDSTSTGRCCIYLASFPFFIVSGTYASAPKDNVYPLPIVWPATTACNWVFTKLLNRKTSR